MSCYEILDPRFGDLIDPVAFLETIHTGNRWAEGPVWFADLRCLVWSDIPNDRMLRWEEETGVVSLFRGNVANPNGGTRDREGRLVTCMQGERRVVRTEWDGSITVLADSFEGKKLNSPNDVVVKSDGSLWFTDPNYTTPWGTIDRSFGRLQDSTGPHSDWRRISSKILLAVGQYMTFHARVRCSFMTRSSLSNRLVGWIGFVVPQFGLPLAGCDQHPTTNCETVQCSIQG